jgi:DNA-binding NtrC family response regulator
VTHESRILVVDDDSSIRNLLHAVLSVEGFQVEAAEDGASALALLRSGVAASVVVLDVMMPGLDGIETLEQIRSISPATKVVMLSCVSDTKKVVRAMQLGAEDYLTKPFQPRDLVDVVSRCMNTVPVAHPSPASEVIELDANTWFVCACPPMQRIKNQAALIARCDIPVLLLGESGCGKDVIARLIHKLSPRAEKPFIKVNCAALPSELLESELFGHEEGAFTGATKAKPGKFELCDGGTIFLDEIGEMSPALQAKLLHVLQDNEFSRLGARSTTKVNVRVVAATNIDVKEAMAAKKLRPDLYYRLNGLQLHVPPLRDRKEEIPLLVRQFASRAAESFGRPSPVISQHFIQACLSYAWPGNLRELQNIVKRYVVLGDEDSLVAELSGGTTVTETPPLNVMPGLKSMLRSMKTEAEAVAISDALQHTHWNRRQAAKKLGISYKSLLGKIRELNLQPPAQSLC